MSTAVETFEHIISQQSTRELVPFLVGLSQKEVVQVRGKALHFLQHGIPNPRPREWSEQPGWTIYPPLSALPDELAPVPDELAQAAWLAQQAARSFFHVTKEESALFFLTGLATYSRKEAFGPGFNWTGSLAHDFFHSRRDEVWAVLAHARPAWLSDWLMGNRSGNGNSLADYWLLRDLADAGFIEYRPPAFAWRFMVLAFYARPDELRQKLRQDTVALQRELLGQFDQERSIASIDSRSAANYEKFTWLNLIVELIATGHLNRLEVLGRCLLALRRDFRRPALTWYVALFHAIQPTPAERLALQTELLDLLAQAQSLVVNFAIRQLKELLPVPEFAAASLLLYMDGLLVRPDMKTGLQTLLAAVVKLPARQPAQAGAVAQVLGRALAYSDGAVQERAAKGLIGLLNSKELLGADAAAIELTISQAWALMTAGTRQLLAPWLAANEAADSATVTTATYTLREDFIPQISPATAIVPVADWQELLFLTGQALNQTDPVLMERWLDGLLRLQDQLPAGYAAQLEPYVLRLVPYLPAKRTVVDVLAHVEEHPFAWEHGLLNSLFLSLYEGFTRPHVGKVALGWGTAESAAPGTFPSIADPLSFVNRHRLAFAEELLAAKRMLPLLSTFTHRPYYVSPEVLVEKLLRYQHQGLAPNLADLTVALARAACGAPAAAAARHLLPQLAHGGLRNLLEWFFSADAAPAAAPFSERQKAIIAWPTTLDEAMPGLWSVAIRTKFPAAALPWLEALEAQAVLRSDAAHPLLLPVWSWGTDKPAPYRATNAVTGLLLYKLHDAMVQRHSRWHGWDGYESLRSAYQQLHPLLPQHPAPLYCHTLRCAAVADNLESADRGIIASALHTLLEAGPSLEQYASRILASGLLHDSAHCRSLAQEVLLRTIASGRLRPAMLGRPLGQQLAIGYAPVPRLTRGLKAVVGTDALTDDALRQVLDALLPELPAEPPRNTRQLLEAYADLLGRLGQPATGAVQARLREWSKVPSLRPAARHLLAAVV